MAGSVNSSSRQAARNKPPSPELGLAFAGSELVTCASFRIYWDLSVSAEYFIWVESASFCSFVTYTNP